MSSLIMPRRRFMVNLMGAIAAPVIIKPDSLMQIISPRNTMIVAYVERWWPEDNNLYRESLINTAAFLSPALYSDWVAYNSNLEYSLQRSEDTLPILGSVRTLEERRKHLNDGLARIQQLKDAYGDEWKIIKRSSRI